MSHEGGEVWIGAFAVRNEVGAFVVNVNTRWMRLWTWWVLLCSFTRSTKHHSGLKCLVALRDKPSVVVGHTEALIVTAVHTVSSVVAGRIERMLADRTAVELLPG